VINEACINPLDLVDGLNNRHEKVKVFAFHRIVAPRNDSIGGIMRMSWD